MSKVRCLQIDCAESNRLVMTIDFLVCPRLRECVGLDGCRSKKMDEALETGAGRKPSRFEGAFLKC